MASSETPADSFVFIDPSYLECVLAAGDASDLPALREWCAQLPEGSYGQVFIEVFSPIQIEPLDTPRRVGVTWICREYVNPGPRAGVSIPRGQALATAVDAWLDEWLRADPASGRSFTMWKGGRSTPVMCDFWTRIENELAGIRSAYQPRHG